MVPGPDDGTLDGQSGGDNETDGTLDGTELGSNDKEGDGDGTPLGWPLISS